MADSRALYAAQKEALALVGADPALRSPGNAGLRRLAEELCSGDTALNCNGKAALYGANAEPSEGIPVAARMHSL